MPRNTLACVLAGHEVDLSDPTSPGADALLLGAYREGVLALLGNCLSQVRQAPPEFLAALASRERALAASSLVHQAECRRVLAALPREMPVLVLKGAALGQWLYPQPYLRECSDIDLLQPAREDVEHTVACLRPLGYAIHYVPSDLAHELLCRRESGHGMSVDLDLHWRLLNAPMFADVFTFEELHAASIPLPSLGPNARGLSPVHAFVHAALHRSLNLSAGIGDRLKWLYDFHLLGHGFDQAAWQSLLDLAQDRRISGVCASAIDATSQLFGAVAPAAVIDQLRADTVHDRVDASRLADWKYMQWKNVTALPSWSIRVRWLWQNTLPPTGYLQALYGSQRGRFGLLMERGKRAWQRLSL